MFAGLIEELGTVKNTTRNRLTISSGLEPRRGDSVAVNGVCLTVVDCAPGFFSMEVVEETLKKSNIGELKVGNRVNLERALRPEGRLGGHVVMGHVDEVGVIKRKVLKGNSWELAISFPSTLSPYIISKGSIAVDGISLTVANLGRETFEIAIIPHTAQVTTLGFKRVGDKVNLEVDVLGKYVEKVLKEKEVSQRVTPELLKEAGFIK